MILQEDLRLRHFVFIILNDLFTPFTIAQNAPGFPFVGLFVVAYSNLTQVRRYLSTSLRERAMRALVEEALRARLCFLDDRGRVLPVVAATT